MRKVLKILLRVLTALVILVLLVPVLLYLPPVQDLAVSIATREIKKSTGMTVEVGRLRITPPLDLLLSDVRVIQANADTMLTAGNLKARVALLPLINLDIDVTNVGLDSVFYQLNNPDSLMWLRARIDRADIDGADIRLKSGGITLGNAHVDGADVYLRMLPDTVPVPTDTASASADYLIKAGNIRLSRVRYRMEMLPVIDSLGCTIGDAVLRDATVDMPRKRIYGRSLTVDSVAAAYIYPVVSADAASATAADSTVTDDSEMWTVTADSLSLTGRSALYAERGHKPLPGFDPSYIAATDIDIRVDSFYNRGTSVRVPLRKFAATERCGLALLADGLFVMDDKMMRAKDFNISTLKSVLRFNAAMGTGDLTSDPTVPLTLLADARIDPTDVVRAFPDMKAMLAPVPAVTMSTDIDGTSGQLNIYSLSLNAPGLARLKGQGTVDNPFDPAKIGGDVSLEGALASLTDREFSFLPIKHTPALSLRSDIRYMPGQASGYLEVTADGGRIAADGSWTARTEDYDATLALDDFPVSDFMPELGVGRVTADLKVDGRGYNPMKSSTSIDADAVVHSIDYNRRRYSDIALDVALHAGEATGTLVSRNPGADMSADFTALISGDTVRYDLTGDLRDIDLLALGLTDSVNGGHAILDAKGYYDLATQGMDVAASVDNLYWRLPGILMNPGTPIDLTLLSDTAGTAASLRNGDLDVKFHSGAPILAFVDSLMPATDEIMHEVDSMRIDVRRLGNMLPRFALHADMGQSNIAAEFLRSSDINIGRLNATLRKDSLISMNAGASRLNIGTTRIDSVSFNALQHGDYLVYNAAMDNRPGTFDDFAHVTLRGFAGYNRASVFMNQKNIKGEKGFVIGLNASIADSVIRVHLVPRKPIIAYKTWELNDSNYISYDLADKHIHADMSLSNGPSYLRIFTEGHDSTGADEDVVVRIANVAIQDWLSINPFAPPVKGNLSADMRFRYDPPMLTGRGTMGLADLYYGRDRVGTFDLDLNLEAGQGGKLMADVGLMVDSVRTVTARGVVNDSTLASPFLLDFNMIKFPLHVANPFLPAGTATLSGTLNGNMKITGDMAHPVFDGYIDFDTAAVKVTMLGTNFRFSEEKIPVDSNVVRFSGFTIKGANENPLTIDGTVDLRSLTDIGIDLAMNARNIQIVNSSRARGGADVYGKAFLDLSGTARGSMERLSVDADLSLLEETNVTYVIPDVSDAISQQADQDMVHFVQFSDTLQTAKADSLVNTGMLLNVTADLHFNQGAVINVDLSSSGSDKAQIAPSGNLDFSMSPLNGMRMTGRLDIHSGFVRYHPPVISEVNFKFRDGSYIAFNGDVLNPVLNIHADEIRRANVTQSGQNSRLVNFDVSVAVTNTLENMSVAFDLSTDDDITVQNELSSMSPDQRANQAMNLLLYNTYTGAGTKATTAAGNPLYSFLSSQINNWAASNIRGVDLSFGIDQYDRTYNGSTSTTTSYNYRVSKSLFNDRFKIIVGGNYSTDADADENFSQNLINDISFEYMLNRSGTMYVRIFRHTGYESILEGEITQTGVGFVLKRKLNSLRDLFGLRRKTITTQ